MIESLKKTYDTLSKKNKLVYQFAQYFGAALIGLFFDFATLVILKEVFNLNYLLAAAGGFILGLVVVFVLSDKFVFSNPKIKSKHLNFILFGVIGLVGLGLLSFFMWLFTGVIGINYIISKVLATVFVYMWNFFARRSLYHS